MIPGVESWGECEEEFMLVLSDGKPHPLYTFYRNDKNPNNLNSKLSATQTIRRIRRKLEGTGYAVVTSVQYRTSYWQLVRLISMS